MFFRIKTLNQAMNGVVAEEQKREKLQETEYVLVKFCLHGLPEFAWYQLEQLEPIEPPEAWFGQPVKVK